MDDDPDDRLGRIDERPNDDAADGGPAAAAATAATAATGCRVRPGGRRAQHARRRRQEPTVPRRRICEYG